MVKGTDVETSAGSTEHTEDDEHETHELPRGALLITLTYLLILTLLWAQVYLQLLNSGGIPRP